MHKVKKVTAYRSLKITKKFKKKEHLEVHIFWCSASKVNDDILSHLSHSFFLSFSFSFSFILYEKRLPL